jgi:AraC-like DNA-binding protein
MNAFLETSDYETEFPVRCFASNDNNFLAHWHMDIELVYVLSGSIKIGINTEYRILHQGELAVFISTDIHYYDSTNLSSNIIVLKFKPELIGYKNSWPEKVKFSEPFITKKILSTVNRGLPEILENIFVKIVEEMNASLPYHELYVKGKLAELCSLLLRHFSTVPIDKNDNLEKSCLIERMQQTIRFLENNYSEDISLEDVARETNLNPSYFSRIFKSYVGINYKEYISRMRIEKAETLLITTNYSIIDICFQCGFNSVRSFNRTFKQIRGYTPSKVQRK